MWRTDPVAAAGDPALADLWSPGVVRALLLTRILQRLFLPGAHRAITALGSRVLVCCSHYLRCSAFSLCGLWERRRVENISGPGKQHVEGGPALLRSLLSGSTSCHLVGCHADQQGGCVLLVSKAQEDRSPPTSVPSDDFIWF